MLDEKDLQAIAKLLQPIHERLDGIGERLSKLEDDGQVTRNGVNTLLEWAEDASITVKVPLFRKAE